MKQQDIIQISKQSNLVVERHSDGKVIVSGTPTEIEYFAELIAKAKAEEIATACERLPFGDTAHSFAIWIREQ